MQFRPVAGPAAAAGGALPGAGTGGIRHDRGQPSDDLEPAAARTAPAGLGGSRDRGLLEDGYLRLEGRIKELIIRGGENISPGEVEDALKAHPAVSDAVCFGIDDDKYGQVVGAAVVLRGEADPAQLRARCRASLADFKVPRVIHVVSEIPRTPTGKVQRSLIASRLNGRQR